VVKPWWQKVATSLPQVVENAPKHEGIEIKNYPEYPVDLV
jgi:hypothetical protein